LLQAEKHRIAMETSSTGRPRLAYAPQVKPEESRANARGEDSDGSCGSDGDDFLPIKGIKSRKRCKFPPGCQVTFCEYKNPAVPLEISRVVRAEVDQFGIDLETKEYCYKLKVNELGQAQPVIVITKNGGDLRFDQRSPVWFFPAGSNNNSEKLEAVVVGRTECFLPQLSVVYDVQLSNGQKSYHGVSAERLRYRHPQTAIETKINGEAEDAQTPAEPSESK
jgi:hypothetical protein